MADYGIYEGIEKVCRKVGGKVVMDSAFNCDKRDYLIKYSQKDPMDYHILLVNHETTMVMPLIEWDMMMIEDSYPYLKGTI